MFDFANLLFSGPCNARCPFCIGRQIDRRLNQDNLNIYPPRNLEMLVHLVWQYDIHHVVFSGTNTDPQLYRHEARLLAELRRQLPAGVQISLHTNGRLALQKLDIFNCYDRVTLSFPSFDPATYRQVMGVTGPPDLAQIVRRSSILLKVSCVLTPYNLPYLQDFLLRCAETGISRVVLRKLFGEQRAWNDLLNLTDLDLEPRAAYRTNPVFELAGIEVTLWDFEQTSSRSINLFGSGMISQSYLLTSRPPAPALPAFILGRLSHAST
jgi:MoaA/NifB/PqqE/SkfB family radical SAM enzyme